MKGTKKIFRGIALAVALLAAGQSAWAQVGTFTVEYITGGTFKVKRTSNTSATETVLYRTVSLSAFAGMHFTAASGELSFDAMNNERTVTITEITPTGDEADRFTYQTSGGRSYRFEVLDQSGNYLTHCDRTVTDGLTQFHADKVNGYVHDLVTMTSSGDFSSGMPSDKYIDVSFTPPIQYIESGTGVLSGYVLIDDEYKYAYKPAPVSTSALIYSTGAPASYLTKLHYYIYATVCFTEQERDDGYQYVQIVAGDASAACDDDRDDEYKEVYDPVNSVYKVCYELSTSNTQGYGKAYFPHRVDGTKEFSIDGKLWEQKFKSSYTYNYNGNGSVIFPATTSYITTRFDAGGEGNDTWGYKDLFVRMALRDATQPAILFDSGMKSVVSPGPYYYGKTVYISVPFTEIVVVTDTPTLSTSWGTLKYFSGSGSNVLTFSGTIDAPVGTKLTVKNISLSGAAYGTSSIKDLADNQLSLMMINSDYSYTVASPWSSSSVTLTQGTKDGVTAWWGTFYDSYYNYTLGEGAEAYTMDTDHKLYRLGTDGRTIPKNTAVVILAIEATPDSPATNPATATIQITPVSTDDLTIDDNALGGNQLHGSDSAVPLSGLSGTPYVLSVDGTAIGFRKYVGSGSDPAIPAYKAYYVE
ncbi:MAG: hypothetical protein J5639_03495 [Bacteroidales bacterium]|nr:hypothetical protein [Bacteroidales bacterium]